MIRVASAYEDQRAAIISRLRAYRSMVANYQAHKDLYDSLFPSAVQRTSDMPPCRTEVHEGDRYADRRLEQFAKMELALLARCEAYRDIEGLIEGIPDTTQQTVIVRRYVLNESWEAIALKLHCHRNTARRWHDDAVEKMVHHSAS